jgi:hypothetical protein
MGFGQFTERCDFRKPSLLVFSRKGKNSMSIDMDAVLRRQEEDFTRMRKEIPLLGLTHIAGEFDKPLYELENFLALLNKVDDDDQKAIWAIEDYVRERVKRLRGVLDQLSQWRVDQSKIQESKGAAKTETLVETEGDLPAKMRAMLDRVIDNIGSDPHGLRAFSTVHSVLMTACELLPRKEGAA